MVDPSALLIIIGVLVSAGADTQTLQPTFQAGETEVMQYKTPERSGVVNGIKYRYQINRSGKATFAVVGDWVIRQRVDEMDDSETWYIEQEESKLMVFPSASGQAAEFCVLFHDFPGRRPTVRSDANPPITGVNGRCFTSPVFFKQLLTASTVRTRRYEWPNDYGVVSDGDAAGFSETLKLLSYMKRTKFVR